MLQKTAQYLKDNLIYTENVLLWNYGYYPLNSKKFDKIDDVSHGTLVVEFMSKCFDMGIVFSKDDMISLVNLFLTKIYKDGVFNLNIDGSGGIYLLMMYTFIIFYYYQNIIGKSMT
ncbi:MAG: hypothetical protein IPO04_05840 [Cytophagaceae bacterium]|nr:hypothetical protein [Cytophagaceae bacterium]